MKIGIYTDPHFSSAEVTCRNRYNSKSLVKIDEAYKYFTQEKCNLVICLGDITDNEPEHAKEVENVKKISATLQKYDIPTYVVMGNHDAFTFEVDEFYTILGEQYRPQNIYNGVHNLIFIDACYFKSGVHYMPGDCEWTDTFYPDTKYLEKTLKTLSGDVYIFMHQNIDPSIREDHRLSNDAEIRTILENSGNVKTVFQGHYHFGRTSEHNGIQYVTFPAVCENENAYYIVEI